jgi:hypothetical protein
MILLKNKQDLFIAIQSFIIGNFLLFNSSLFIYQEITVFIGLVFVVKGFLWAKSCYIKTFSIKKRIDYSGIMMAFTIVFLAIDIIQTHIWRGRGGWIMKIDTEWSYVIAIILILSAYHIIYSSLECLRIHK